MRLKELIEMGAYIQINCRSLLGGKRKSGFSLENRAAWCKKLVREGCIHFLASDCHNSSTRKPMMKEAVEIVRKIAGENAVKRITRDNVRHLMKDEEL